MRDNGLTANSYTSMGGIDPQIAEPVLKALAEAGIAAYCGTPSEATAVGTTAAESAGGAAETASGTPSSPPQPSGAEGAAKADAQGTSGGASPADPPSNTSSSTGAAPSSPAQPSGAEGDAKADRAEAASGAATSGAPEPASPAKPSGAEGAAKAEVTARVPVGFEEMFVDAGSEVRARGVIARSSEDAEWASLVQQFNLPSAEGHDATPVPRWPASEDVDEGSYEPLIDVPAGLIVGDTDEDPPEEPPARRTEDHHEHFVPPEPPRGPKLDWISRAAWLGLIGGPALLILAALLDFGTGRITTLAVVGFIGGFLTLVIRMKDRLPPEDTPDDGAVV
ncbi:MAG: hypothetical protein QOH84_5430 [Kribbellaceae bacterium]|nr:hypothetical protein [Kribbellaceae bacterium]